jgi:tRNA A-37 threonylcarbamoyl transferase component Bud32
LGGRPGLVAPTVAAVSVRWERITRLFDAARALEDADRAAFLDAACASDPTLRSEIEAQLAADAVDDGFLAASPYTAIVREVQALHQPLPQGLVLKDRYLVDRPFGSGGQANVYLATDRMLSRPVILKVMRAAGVQNALLRQRFEQEREALSRIDHPAVVGIFDVGELNDGTPFLVIQYIDGVSLRAVLQDGPLEPPRCARIVAAIAGALGAAHAAGVTHQDLKPENVMVQRLGDGTEIVKLIDFGIAKIDRSDLDPAVTMVMVAGTVRYMAPEQFQGLHLPASDTYSLGLLACELLCGSPDVRALPRSSRPSVRRLLEHAVAWRPEDRPANVSEWAGQFSASLGARRPRLMLAAGAVVAIVAALASVTFGRGFGFGSLEGHERIIEKVGAFDPLTEGFQLHGQVAGTVVDNHDHTGYIGWSISSATVGGGYYYRTLTNAQKGAAISRGWALSGIIQPQAGHAYVLVDFAGYDRRFDININVEQDMDVVWLTTQLVPTIQGMELRLPRSEPVYRTYELRFDPGLQAADLWIDGRKTLTGYRGHRQFQDDVGVMFGTGPYRASTGVASFQRVRFEIHP